jgi:hypothetical protein
MRIAMAEAMLQQTVWTSSARSSRCEQPAE